MIIKVMVLGWGGVGTDEGGDRYGGDSLVVKKKKKSGVQVSPKYSKWKRYLSS